MYDVDWKRHKYFLSSQETGFEVSMLQRFDAELLIGIVSYKQKAEIYNVCNNYDIARKERKQQQKLVEESDETGGGSRSSLESGTILSEQRR